MDRRTFLPGIALGLFAALCAAHSQPAGKLPHIGLLMFDAPSPRTNTFLDAFMEGLRERGYVEGQSLVIERRYARGRPEWAAELAAELARSRVDLIVIFGPGPLQAARQATQTIPLVMLASSSDPVADGIAQSLARPGGNITGLTYAVSAERFGKQLELLKLAVGAINRVAVLWDLDLEMFRKFWAAPLKDAGRGLGLSVMPPTQVRDARELPAAFSQIKQQQADAVLVATGGPINAAREQVAELAIAHRLPAIAAFKVFPQTGLLMSYGPDLAAVYRRGADYVARILTGAKPGDLPIELPSRYELVINLKTAKALGIAIPPSLLLRADEVLP